MPDNGDNEENNEDSEETYEFEAGGESCDTCQSMVGEYNYRPSPPHPSCRCCITRKPENCENVWSIVGWQKEWIGHAPSYTLMLYIQVQVTCWDESTHETMIDIDFTLDIEKLQTELSDEEFEQYFAELFWENVCEAVSDDAEAFAEEVCPDCNII